MSKAWQKTVSAKAPALGDWREFPQRDVEAAWKAWKELSGDKDAREFTPIELQAWQIFRVGFLFGRRPDMKTGTYGHTFMRFLARFYRMFAVVALAFFLLSGLGETVQASGNRGVEMGLGRVSEGPGQLLQQPVNLALGGDFFDSRAEDFVRQAEGFDRENFAGKRVGSHVDQERENVGGVAGFHRALHRISHLGEELREFRGVVVPNLAVKNASHARVRFTTARAGFTTLNFRPSQAPANPCPATSCGVRTPIFHGGKAAVALEGAAAAPCIFRAQEAAESDRRGISFPSAQPGAVLACKVAGTVAAWVANFGCAQPQKAALGFSSFSSAATPFPTGATKPEIDFTLPVDAVDFLTWEDAK